MVLPYQAPPPPPANDLGLAWSAWGTRVVDAVRGLLDGKMNARGELTLDANADTTTLTDSRIGPTSMIIFTPQTASAPGDATMYVSMQTAGQATVTHANDPATDRTFRYLIIG